MSLRYFVAAMSLVFYFQFSGPAARAAVTEWPIEPQNELIISLPEAEVKILASAAKATNTLRLNISETGEPVDIFRQGDRIEIRAKELADKKEFGRSHGVKLIEVSGASLPLQVHLQTGSIFLSGGSSSARLNIQKGKIVVRSHEGPLFLHSQKGEVSVIGQKGQVSADFNQANFSASKVDGNLELTQFAGDVVLNDISGVISLNQNQGQAKVEKSTGALHLDLMRPSLKIKDFAGRIEGETREASVTADLPLDFDVNLKAQGGRLKFSTPAPSGAYLSLYSESGEIYLPPGLKIARWGEFKSFRGRLKGGEKKGRIIVRSENGAIIVGR